MKDIAKWNTERKNKRILRSRSTNTTEEAESFGFTGTPSFAIKGPGTKGIETLGTPGAAEVEEAIEEGQLRLVRPISRLS